MQLLLAIALGLQGKHLIADFLLQTRYMLAGKGRYGHPGGLMHAGLHAALSLLLLLLAGVPLRWALLIAALEFAVHYHLDWSKDRWITKSAATPGDARFWRALGVDQFLHQLTYLAMIAAALAVA